MNCKPCSRRVSLLDREMREVTRALQTIFLWQTPRCAGAKNCNSMLSRECARRDFCHVHFLLCKNAGCAELHYIAETRHEISQELKISEKRRTAYNTIAFFTKPCQPAFQLIFFFCNVGCVPIFTANTENSICYMRYRFSILTVNIKMQLY